MNKTVARAVKAEREACAQIALAIDSGRGNEKEIARAIRARGELSSYHRPRTPDNGTASEPDDGEMS